MTRDKSTRISLAGLLIGIAGFCVALAAVPTFISAMGGLPDPGRQSDFFFEILFSQLCGSCCILVVVCLVTFAAIAYVTPRSTRRRD